MDQRTTSGRLAVAVANAGVVDRYRAKIQRPSTDGCWIWTGAISGRGHGRFWVATGFVVIAHRFGYALEHGAANMPALLAYQCDNPLCQNPSPAHLRPATSASNSAEWASRRHTIGSPLRDLRGSLGRASALRDAARDGIELEPVAMAGLGVLDANQAPLWTESE